MRGRQFIFVGLILSAVATLLAPPDLGVLPPDFPLSKVFLIFAGVTLLIGVPWWLVEISQGLRGLRKRSGSTGVGDAGHGSEDS